MFLTLQLCISGWVLSELEKLFEITKFLNATIGPARKRF